MATPLLVVKDLSKKFDEHFALRDFSFRVHPGEIVGLVGPNGAGKSTVLNIISGLVTDGGGEIWIDGQKTSGLAPDEIARAGVARTFQRVRIIRRLTVGENVRLALPHEIGERLLRIFLTPILQTREDAENREKAYKLLAETGLNTKAEDRAETLSYGEQKLLTLVCCMATRARLFLLDEPVAGIAPEMTKRICDLIRSLPVDDKARSIQELLRLASGNSDVHELLGTLSRRQRAELSDSVTLAVRNQSLDQLTLVARILSAIFSLIGEGSAVILSEHNQDVVDSICNRVIFMHRGRKVAEGSPVAVKSDPRVLEAYTS